MALNLGKALAAYDRLDTAKVDCGRGWFWEIKPLSAVSKLLAKEQARVRTMGIAKGRIAKTASAALANTDTPTEDQEYLLGSYKADVTFFVENISVGWTNLIDDDDKDVPYSQELAIEILTETGKRGEQLYRDLLMNSLNQEFFLRTPAQDAEEDGKN